MDYSVFDLRSFFTLEEAGKAWCNLTHVTPETEYRLVMISGEMVTAILAGELPAKVPSSVTGKMEDTREHHGQYAPCDLAEARISKEDLKAWALQRGIKPKFLFPEERDKSEQESTPRQSQLDKACCQAIARLIWDMEPKHTITDLTADRRILKYGNGNQYAEKTLKEWLREVDPRPLEEKTGRPKKVIEKI